MKPTRTWILLADASSARIIENSGPGKGLFQLKDKTYSFDPPRAYSDQEGRTFNSASPARHKMETNIEKDAELAVQLDEVLSELKRSFDSNDFSRLIICAAPHVLGLIRKRLPNALQPHILAEIPKDLTRTPTNELGNHLENFLAV